MYKFIYARLARSEAVKISEVRGAAALAFNKVTHTKYEVRDYRKDGTTPTYRKEYATYEEVYHSPPVPKRYVELLALGNFATNYPDKKLGHKIQAAFNEELPKQEWAAVNHVYWEYRKKLSYILGEVPVYLTGVAIIVLVIMGVTRHL